MTEQFRVLLTWLTSGSGGDTGSALADLLWIVKWICGLAFPVIYRRYVGLLGANRRVPAERQAYDALRASLVEGNLAARLYAQQLAAVLDAVERFFGDAGMANQTLFPRAFGLRTPAPLWTAPGFDRCLLLALIYPLATIFVIWAISGHVGPAEAALGLTSDLSRWQRGITAAWVAFCIFAMWRYTQAVRIQLISNLALPPKDRRSALARFLRIKGWKVLPWSVVIMAVLVVVVLVAGPVVLTVNVVFILPLGLALAAAVASAGGLAGGLTGAFGVAMVPTFGSVSAVTGAGAFAIIMAVAWLRKLAIKHRSQSVFLSVFLPAMILIYLSAASLLVPLQASEEAGPLLLFMGLLTLLNAPFDWTSLGLTRALLRRGLELGGWWPYLLAIFDALLAAVIVAALALVMVIGVQAFDGLAEHSGGAPVLPLNALFDGIAADPTAPEYWWLYALLLSTMIPSLVNLVIAGASLLRGLPVLPALLLRFIPARGGALKWDRAWIALVLTFQVFGGAALGVAAQVLLAVGIIGYVMPWLGFGLLDTARDVAAFNLPARVGQLFGVTL
jgi:hypothetical protein